MTARPQPEFTFPVDVTSLPQVGRAYTITADADARARVAARLGVQDISRLSATFELMPRAGGLVRVTGTVEADLTQSCVVTLGPVPAAAKESVDVTFTTYPAGKTPAGNLEEDVEELVGLGEEEPPEEALDGQIDLGEVAVVQLALGLDPYPRAPGAAFKAPSWVEKGEESQGESPFAVLAQLQKKSPPKGH